MKRQLMHYVKLEYGGQTTTNLETTYNLPPLYS